MSIGVTGISIAPELGLHFHKGSLSFFERLCCCCTSEELPLPELNDQIYITDKLKAMRWRDKTECNGMGATHARLKLLAVQRFQRISDDPFYDAERAFDMAQVSWIESKPIYRHDLERLNVAMGKIKQALLTDPLDVHTHKA